MHNLRYTQVGEPRESRLAPSILTLLRLAHKGHPAPITFARHAIWAVLFRFVVSGRFTAHSQAGHRQINEGAQFWLSRCDAATHAKHVRP
jgi:hypothetical protein